MTIQKVTFKTASDLKSYIKSLAESGMLYHFDDDVSEIVWSVPVSSTQLEILRHNDKQLWIFCDENNIEPFVYCVEATQQASVSQQPTQK